MKTTHGLFAVLLLPVLVLALKIGNREKGEISDFLFPTAIFYLEEKKPFTALLNFHSSPLGKELQNIDYDRLGLLLGLEPWVASTIEKTFATAEKLLANPIMGYLLNQKIGFILAGPDCPAIKGQEAFFEDSFVVAVETSFSAHLHFFAAKRMLGQNGYRKKSIRQYGDHHITRLHGKNGRRVHLAVIDNLMLASLNERLLCTAIDSYDGDRPKISQTKEYSKLRKAIGEADRFAWLCLDGLRSALLEYGSKTDPPYKDLLKKQIKTTLGFKAIAYGAWLDADYVTDKLIASFDHTEVNAISRRYLSRPPTISTMLHLRTAQPSLYYWSNTLDLKYLADHFIEKSDNREKTSEFLSLFTAYFGVEMAEFFSYFKDQASFVVEPAGPGVAIKIPRFAAFFTLNNHGGLDTAIKNAMASSGIVMAEKNINDFIYHYWKDYPQDGLQFLCGVWQDFFVIANSAILVEEIVEDARQKRRRQELWDLLDPGFSLPNNSLTYFNNIDIITIIENLITVFGTVAVLEDKKVAARSQQLASLFFAPILEGLKMYEISSTRSYFTKDLVVIETLTQKSRE